MITFKSYDPDSMLAAFRLASDRYDIETVLASSRGLLSWLLHDGPAPTGVPITHAMSEAYAGVKWAERELAQRRIEEAEHGKPRPDRPRAPGYGRGPRSC